MKVRNLFFAVLASAAVLVGCEKKENYGDAKLELSESEITFDSSSELEKTITLITTRDWRVQDAEKLPNWIKINPMSGKASSTAQDVTITVLENTKGNRSCEIVFTIGTFYEPLQVSQSGPEGNMLSIEEVIAIEKDKDVETSGTVAGVNERGFILTDGKDNILVYAYDNSEQKLGVEKLPAIGDRVIVKGKKAEYGGIGQIATPIQLEVKSSGNTVEYTEVNSIADADFDKYTSKVSEYISFEGTYTVSGNYHNVIVEGATKNQGSISYPLADFSDKYNGHKIKITGFFVGYTNSKFVNVLIVNVEDKGVVAKTHTSIADFYGGALNDLVQLKDVLVMAKHQRGLVISDGTDYAYVFTGTSSAPTANVGDKIDLEGAVSEYQYAAEPRVFQISSSDDKIVVKSSGNTVTHPTPEDLSSAAALDVVNYSKVTYVTADGGRYTVSGNNHNVTIDGATKVISLHYPVEDYSAWVNQRIAVSGYYYQTSMSSDVPKYVQLITTGIKASTKPFVSAQKLQFNVNSDETSVDIEVISNTSWTATTVEGVTLSKASGENNETITVNFAANEDTEKAKTYTVTLKASGCEDVVVTITQAKKSADGEVTVSKLISEISGITSGSGIKVSSMVLDDVITLTASDGTNNGKVYSNGADWRFYQTDKGSLTVAAKSGYELLSVKITYTKKNTGIFLNGSTQVDSGTVDNVTGSSVVYSVGNTNTNTTNGNVQITAIEVTYKKTL